MSRVTSLFCSFTHPTLFRTFRGYVEWISPQRNWSAWFLPAGCVAYWHSMVPGIIPNAGMVILASITVQSRGPTTPINSLTFVSSLGRPWFLTYTEALFRGASESIATASSGQFFLLCTAHGCPFPAPENRWWSHLFLRDDSGLFPWVSLFQVYWGIHWDPTNCSRCLLSFVPLKSRRQYVFL